MPSTNNADELIRSICNFTSKTEIGLQPIYSVNSDHTLWKTVLWILRVTIMFYKKVKPVWECQ